MSTGVDDNYTSNEWGGIYVVQSQIKCRSRETVVVSKLPLVGSAGQILAMGFRAWLSVFLVLFGIGLQIQADQLPDWFTREAQDQSSLSDWAAYHLLQEDHAEESVDESSLPEPQRTVQEPVRKALKKRAQEPFPLQSKQTLQGPVKQLSWMFPRMPEKPKEPERPFVLREPVPANSVAVRCREADVQVEVNQDFFGTGQLIHPADLSLGDCAVTGEDPSDQVLVFEYELHRCDSKIQVRCLL